MTAGLDDALAIDKVLANGFMGRGFKPELDLWILNCYNPEHISRILIKILSCTCMVKDRSMNIVVEARD